MVSRIIKKIEFNFLQQRIRPFSQFGKTEFYNSIDPKIIEINREILRPYYDNYVNEVSTADMAASLELATFQFTICQHNRYTKLLDLGSGLSSFVFRLYAKGNPAVKVYSVDDDSLWLGKTKDFLHRHVLDTQNICTLEQFLKLNEADFDCILHDLNFVEVRIKYVRQIMKMIKVNGIVIFDDVHKPDYLFELLTILKDVESKVYTIKPVTLDSYGRFSLVAVK